MMSLLPLRLSVPEDFDFPWAVRFLAARAVPSLEMVRDDEYSRVIWPATLETQDAGSRGGDPVVLGARFSAASAGAGSRLEVWSVPALPPKVLRAAVTRLFDLDAVVAAFRGHVARDPVLGPLMRRDLLGIRLPQLLDPFECLVRAILGQQVSVAAATTMVGRLVQLLGTPVPESGNRLGPTPRLAFPRPADLVRAGSRRLRALGLMRSKAATLLAAAEAADAGGLDLARLRRGAASEVDAALIALPGIGSWTASYVRLRAFGDRDAFPAADLGVLKALAARGIARDAVAAVAERWRPWRGYAALHLWRSLELDA
jgi:3-methyladenine DNA glycosylase/8-oxoguanine DNA glycosylase